MKNQNGSYLINFRVKQEKADTDKLMLSFLLHLMDYHSLFIDGLFSNHVKLSVLVLLMLFQKFSLTRYTGQVYGHEEVLHGSSYSNLILTFLTKPWFIKFNCESQFHHALYPNQSCFEFSESSLQYFFISFLLEEVEEGILCPLASRYSHQ